MKMRGEQVTNEPKIELGKLISSFARFSRHKLF